MDPVRDHQLYRSTQTVKFYLITRQNYDITRRNDGQELGIHLGSDIFALNGKDRLPRRGPTPRQELNHFLDHHDFDGRKVPAFHSLLSIRRPSEPIVQKRIDELTL